MRYSANPFDSGHPAYEELRREGKDVRVYLNGILQNYVITADDEQRIVEVITERPYPFNPEWQAGHVYLETYYR